MPTSMTTAPGLTMLLVMNPGLPTAATRISALRVCWARFTVWLWQMVTVQFACSSSIAIGLPTMLLRPTTTASLPSRSIPVRRIISIAPLGVHATTPGCPLIIRPALSRWKPSTSFSGAITASAAASSRCFGRGSCTRMPWMVSSAFRRAISFSSSSCVVVSGRLMVTE